MSYEDLPLFPETESRTPGTSPRPAPRHDPGSPPSLAPLPASPRHAGGAPAADPVRPPLVPRPRPRPQPAPLSPRLFAAVLDGVALGALLALAVLGGGALGAVFEAESWGPLALLASVLSFLYTTLPLAFWGQTPGMAAASLTARSPGDRPLSFRQAAVRWFAALLTLALAGLPGLLALTGASLVDRLSGSATLRVR